MGELDVALSLNPKHLSLYSLTIESNTPYEISRQSVEGQADFGSHKHSLPGKLCTTSQGTSFQFHQKSFLTFFTLSFNDVLMPLGVVFLPSEDEAADMYEATVDKLSQNGFEQYEVSNFAANGERSVWGLSLSPFLARVRLLSTSFHPNLEEGTHEKKATMWTTGGEEITLVLDRVPHRGSVIKTIIVGVFFRFRQMTFPPVGVRCFCFLTSAFVSPFQRLNYQRSGQMLWKQPQERLTGSLILVRNSVSWQRRRSWW